MLLPIFEDIFRYCCVNACHIGKQSRACRIQIHPNAVYTILHHAAECLAETLLVHIMLILSHTDGFRVDFHQFRQRVLDSSADGNRAPQRNIIIGKFLRAQLGCGIHRCPCLIRNDILHPAACLFQHFRHKKLRFPGGCAVADGD